MTDLPLQGIRIVVTRSKKQAAGLSSKFRELGAEVYEFPVISITPPDSWAPLDEAIEKIKRYDWVLFASANAVDAFVARADEVGIGKEGLDYTKFAVIGPLQKHSWLSFLIILTCREKEFSGRAPM
jgi:uroporphyrinogen III methyltransferase / synthase